VTGLAELTATYTGRVSKAESRRRDASNAALTASGATVAGAGLLGGGVPGVRADSSRLKDVVHGPAVSDRLKGLAPSARAGVFGYRHDAHKRALDEFVGERDYYKNSKANRTQMFQRGKTVGKINPEVEVLRHMKKARLASNAALAGGVGLAAYGVKRAKGDDVRKDERRSDGYMGAVAGGGASVAGVAAGADKLLQGQARRWDAKADDAYEQARRVVPRLKPEMKSDEAVASGRKVFRGKSKKQAEQAGLHRGYGTQARYFARAYRKNAEWARKVRDPAAVAALVGAGGVAYQGAKNHRTKVARARAEGRKWRDVDKKEVL